MQLGINEWNWMENATCSLGFRQCTLPQGMGLYKRKQPDLDRIFPSATPMPPGKHHCNGKGLNSHCSPQTAFIFPRKSSKNKQ